MRHRVFILGVMLAFRMFAGGIWSGECPINQKLKVSGNINKTYHTSTKSNTGNLKNTWFTTVQVGSYLATTRGYTDYANGARVTITGSCSRSLLDFWMGRFALSDASISTVDTSETYRFNVTKWLVNNRDRSVAIFTSRLPSPEAELLSGMVLGAKRELQADFKDALVTTGTIHVVVASGFNVTLVGTVVMAILIYFLPRKRAVWGAVVLTLVYALFTGGEPPVMRAWLMFSFVSLSLSLGYPMLTSWVLTLSIWLMLMVDPSLMLDISFQLTVAATAGLVWLVPFLEKYIKVGGELVPTLAAQIATAPVIISNFGGISPVALPVNLLILPLVTPLTVAASILALSSAFPRLISLPIVWFCYGLSHLFVSIIRVFTRV